MRPRWTALVRLLSVLVVLWMVQVPTAEAQDLAEIYRERWFRETAERVLDRVGRHARPMAPAHLPSPSDSIRWQQEWRHRLDRSHIRVPLVDVTSVRAVRRLERPVFEERFTGIRRTFIGSINRSLVDTEFTRHLRARMQARYGAPTRVVSDLYDESRRRVREYLQFEYWLVVNDSIPLIVMDVDGPFDRGLVLATEAQYRELLPDLKRGFERDLMRTNDYDRFVDFYFNEVEGAWYVTGYDGTRFVLRRIRPPDLRLGRPPIDLLNQR